MKSHQFRIILLTAPLLAACATPATPTTTLSPTAAPPSIGTPIPQPTATSTATPTTTPTLTPVPTPTPIPWTLEGAIAKLPEIYTEAVTPETVEQYTQLLSPLPEEAQWWITGMGWGLENLALDANEVALLELLTDKNVLTAMSILTSPDIIDGVTWGEVTWAQGYEVESLSALLQDDIDELLGQGLLSDEGLAGINRLIGMAPTDSEIAKGLYLVDNFGHPNQGWFQYPLPVYNTQLLILGKLTELEIPSGCEVAAVAAALDYGSLWSISDEEVREIIVPYAHEMLLYQAETDQVLREKGANWQATDWPLEAQIAMVWGGPGNHRTLSVEKATALDWPIHEYKHGWQGFYHYFRRQPFGTDDWNWEIVTLDRLRAIRTHLIVSSRFLTRDPDQLGDNVERYWMEEKLDYQWDPKVLEIDGQHYYATCLGMNYEWDYFEEHGQFIGTSCDSYIDDYLLRSLNWPGIITAYIFHTGTYYFPSSETWKATKGELRISPQVIDTRIAWNKVPFDNFFLDETMHPENDSGRLRFLRPMSAHSVFATGIPTGYIYRADVSTDLGPWPDVQIP